MAPSQHVQVDSFVVVVVCLGGVWVSARLIAVPVGRSSGRIWIHCSPMCVLFSPVSKNVNGYGDRSGICIVPHICRIPA